jgi:hypothetical protein
MNSCKQRSPGGITEKQLSDLHSELMALHDSTMVKHGLSLHLIDQLDELERNQPQAALDSIRDALDQSNEAMMDWMAEYADPVTQDSMALNYLMDQLRLMKEIAQTQASAIDGANTLLGTDK